MATATALEGRNRRVARPPPLIVGLAVLGAAAIGFATLCPIQMRPHLLGANEERFAAYLALGALVRCASGRRWLGSMAIVMVVALGFEAAQRLAPGRHPALSDAIVKAAGGILGAAATELVFPARRLIARWAADRRLVSGAEIADVVGR